MAAEDTVRMAIAATAPGPDWNLRVRDNIRNIAAMLHSHSSEMELARQLDPTTKGAKSFINTVVSMGTFEERSKRWIVEMEIIKPGQRGAGKPETIRSGRADTPEGAAQIAALKAAVGQKCVFFVYLKTMANGDPVRELVHFSPLGDQSVPATPDSVPPATESVLAERAPAEQQSSRSVAPPSADSRSRVTALMASLTGGQKAKLSTAAKANGIPNIMNPGDRIDDLESLARMIQAGQDAVANAAADAAMARLDPDADPFPGDQVEAELAKAFGYTPAHFTEDGRPVYSPDGEPF